MTDKIPTLTQTRTARYQITEAALTNHWSVNSNPFDDQERFYHRGKATVQVRYTTAGAVSLLAYNGIGPVSLPHHEYVGTGRRQVAQEILRHTCNRFDADGGFCETCSKYSLD